MAKDRLRIKINDNLEIAARDVRNIEVRTTIFEAKDGQKVARTKTAYASNLAGAIKICENELPIFSEAKNLEQLKAQFDQFTKRMKEIVEQYKLPNAKEFLGDAKENPKGLYGEDLRKEVEPDWDDDNSDETPSSDDNWEDDDDDWD
ncbi:MULTISPECIES: hypothetical protein [Enterococcus]|jgi:hypothetical protein|uniref:Uncharacterized protein n=1 Tax=Enterococcus raffinosus ATCC 49464 TaxID=1158602 RepID=R2RM50_9ENTE|nr:MULTISPECIES: hypothetical protein [Enterococcus]EOH77029.1 hypothetical protein UAK_02602 [Enterococcus raffinosus ATCC 49464]EOT75722.1 hypothetical protein I590_02546 [Enterococcus raffinosus ATCC 49464]UXK03340.1 hypothetical protein N7K38_11835 [Enterococcus raffinosus]